MKRKKLVLVNPTLSNPFPGFPPLGLGYVAALTPDDWDIEIIDENFDVASFRRCDLVGITGFTAMASRAYQVATMFREHGVPVVMGGIHASMMPDEALRYVDAVVVGEAETVWADVIADVEADRLAQRYQGARSSLEGLVVPRRDLFHKGYVCDTIQTARGCPQDCAFCSVSQFNGFAFRQRPVDEVLAELRTLTKRYLFIVDDNIVGSGPARQAAAIELTRKMAEQKLEFAWYSHAALNVADNEEVLESFSRSGCRMLFLGIESEDRTVLEAMRKKVNLQRSYQEVFRKIHDHHIGIHGSVIFGTDDDTPAMLRHRLEFVLKSHIDVVQFCTLTPYPGTRLFDRLLADGRLRYTDFPADWDRYDLTEVLFEPLHLEVDELRSFMREVGRRIFAPAPIARRFARSLVDTGSFGTAMWCLLVNSIYRTPRDGNGNPDEKLWHLTENAWPAIKLYEKVERHLQVRREPAPGA